MNQQTHWLDLSAIYGSKDYLAKALRLHKQGLMLTNVTSMASKKYYIISAMLGYKTRYFMTDKHSKPLLPICGQDRVGDKRLQTCSQGSKPTCLT